MGYILPLAHYQYKDYQKRVVEDKQDRFFVERPYKAILETQYNEMEQHTYKQDMRTRKKFLFQTISESRELDKIYANVTGKGTLFNDRV